jgi:hypothetical protein
MADYRSPLTDKEWADSVEWRERAEAAEARCAALETALRDANDDLIRARAVASALLSDDYARAVTALRWFYQMVKAGGPDGSDLDDALCDEAARAAEVVDAVLDGRARAVESPTGEQE